MGTKKKETKEGPAGNFCSEGHQRIMFNKAVGPCPVCAAREVSARVDQASLKRELLALTAFLESRGYPGGVYGIVGEGPIDYAMRAVRVLTTKCESALTRAQEEERRAQRAETARRQSESRVAVMKERMRWTLGLLPAIQHLGGIKLYDFPEDK